MPSRVRIGRSSNVPDLPHTVTSVVDGRTVDVNHFPTADAARQFASIQNVSPVSLYEIHHDRGTYLGTVYSTSHAEAVEKFAAIREIDPYSAQNLHARLSPKNKNKN